ncbi:cardiolipin synthase [Clostridium sp. 19966]|uniref:cardiolipin synthase n=1 Tax=Clostridium sp. 19966 TaxID=2768166 RepID=UPI0028E062C5|nr:cardiolipin synthase [Clostridium sp. 19966]MDT8719494.1 cardiolipin synthase [Clostridium sp. 19966]
MNIIFYIGFFIYAAFSISLIILERKKPEKTIAWLLIFIIIPPLAIVLYVFLGRNWKRHKLRANFSPDMQELIFSAINKLSDMEYFPLIELLANNSESPLFVSNEVKIFNNGEEKFKALKKELKRAKHHIHMEYYIVNSDGIGNEIKDILIQKSNEGVKVRFIMDRVGAIRVKKSFLKEMRAAGIEIVQYSYFLAPLLRAINTQINYRNHRKIVVIDGEVGFVGGINIGDEYLGKGKLGFWRDTHLMVKGDFVLGLQAVFIDDYITIREADKKTSFHGEDFKDYFKAVDGNGNKLMQLIKSGPDSRYPSIEQAIMKMITMARDHIYITTPYFVPSDDILEAIRIASLGGIDVKILFPGSYDHVIVHYASRTYLADLAKSGAEIYLYDDKAFVHAKVVTIDGKVSTVGTANMDIRSFELNYEINALIYDKEVTEELETQFMNDLSLSQKVNVDDYDRIPIHTALLEGFSRIFSSLL